MKLNTPIRPRGLSAPPPQPRTRTTLRNAIRWCAVLTWNLPNVAEETNGEVNFNSRRWFSAAARGSLQGVRDGVAQVTYHAGTYTPSELPVANLIGNFAFYNTDPMVMAFASTEFDHQRSRLCRVEREWRGIRWRLLDPGILHDVHHARRHL